MKSEEAIARAREVMRRQHKTLSTERTYLHWLKHFMAAVRQMPNELTSEAKLERFLTDLALRNNVSAATQNQAFNAILFFYGDVLGLPLKNVDALRASRPAQLRHAPSVQDTRDLLARVPNVGGYPTNLIARMLYGCGFRVCEPLNLRIKDVCLDDGTLMLRGAKGRKDRIVALPCSIAEEVRQQMDFARNVWRGDCQNRIPLEIPGQLARKYPEYLFAWPWAWLFPSRHPCKHPISGQVVRYRMHESNVQRAIKAARRKLGIMVLPHELRHAYATHSLNLGVNLKALSEAMGHAQIETTAGYCHATALSVPSPLDRVERTARPVVEFVERTATVPELKTWCDPGGGKGGVCTRAPQVFESGNRVLEKKDSFTRVLDGAGAFRFDRYVMEKLERRRALREELFAGQTSTARRFAVLYKGNPDRARELIGQAVSLECLPGGRQPNPAAWLCRVLMNEGVMY